MTEPTSESFAAAAESRNPGRGPSPFDQLASFRFTYLAFCAFVLLYVFSVRALETLLALRFEALVASASAIDPSDTSPLATLQERLDALLEESRWIRPGGVRVYPIVVGANGRTLLYRPRAERDPKAVLPPLADPLLPIEVRALVSVPHNSLAANGVLVALAAFLLALLHAYGRALARDQWARLERVLAERNALSERAAAIEDELAAVRNRLAADTAESREEAAEIERLRGERRSLVARLEDLERREAALRSEGHRAASLQEEYQALEGLLDEALADLQRKNEEVRTLQQQAQKKPRVTTRADEQLGRRLRTLYKDLELDARALSGLVELRDEAMQLRAEESLKRLCDDSDQAAVRRKVGGLPPHLSIFELGFGGRGRIYYTRGRMRRYRVLAIGDKASQKTDLEYLSRLPREP